MPNSKHAVWRMCVLQCWITLHLSYTVGTGGCYPGGKAAGSLPPSSAEVKNEWRYTSSPPLHLHGVLLS